MVGESDNNSVKAAEGKELSYEDARGIAQNEDKTVRADLAARTDIRPEILYFLAEDPEPEVRLALANNERTPRHADLVLARDENVEVRGHIAQKISKLAPGLSADEQDKIKNMTYQALEALARDEAVRVRQALSEALKDVAHAPPEVIKALAQDIELVVASPVLEFSPVLTDEDILEIIEQDSATGRLSAISRRVNVSGNIVDAIVAHNDEGAIALLLANKSAQIREETLDQILDQAAGIESWHPPLIERPKLPLNAASRIARFVADNLLEKFMQRTDLAEDVLAEVKSVAEKKLADASGRKLAEIEDKSTEPSEETRTPGEIAFEKAQQLLADGKINADRIEKAMDDNDNDMVMALLAVQVGMEMAAIRKMVASKSAKGMVATSWKAGLSAKQAEKLQSKLAQLPASKVLRATEEGEFSLSEDDMEWQFEFISEMA